MLRRADPEGLGEFRAAYERERARLLRRRAVWYHGVLVLLALGRLAFLPFELMHEEPADDGPDGLILLLEDLLDSAVILAIMSAMLAWVVAVRPARAVLLRAEQRVLAATGILQVLSGVVGAPLVLDAATDHDITGPLGPFLVLASLVLLHGTACLFLPWTPREAARPMLPVITVFAIAVPIFSPAPFDLRLVAVVAAPLAAAPGLLVCAVRSSLFAHRFLFRVVQGAYGDLKQELVDARAVHESLLPDELDAPGLRFRYHFRPYRLLGGDFVYARTVEAEEDGTPTVLDVVVLDVTGHGIRACLAVNRVHGELERLFADDPGRGPGEVIADLDRYVRAALAPQGVYATAIAVRVSAAPGGAGGGRVEWSGAGHPAGFLVDGTGAPRPLRSQSPMLGAADRTPRPQAHAAAITPAARVILYTDGLPETRVPGGGLLGIDGAAERLRRAADEAGDGPLDLARLDDGRRGDADDDLLIVEVGVPRSPPAGDRAST